MKTVIATVIFGLFSMQSAQAAECSSCPDHKSVDNDIAVCCGTPVAAQPETVAVVQGGSPTPYLQSSFRSGNEYAAAV